VIASRRITDNPLSFLKEDLLLALRRIQIDLETGQEGLADPPTLEAMIDAIDQVRSPLAMLEHREAVALLDEMRVTVMEAAHNALLRFDPALMGQAVEQPLRPCVSYASKKLLKHRICIPWNPPPNCAVCAIS
jgi:hypothetical protein